MGDLTTTDLVSSSGCNNAPNGNDDYTGVFGGTSAAAPQVAGVAALVIAKYPNMTRAEVENRLIRGADSWGAANTFGAGKVNAYRSVVPGPSVSISGRSVVRPGATCSWDASVSGGTPPFQYSWSVGGGYTPGTSSFTYTNTGSNFTVWVSVTDANGWAVAASKAVSISSGTTACLF